MKYFLITLLLILPARFHRPPEAEELVRISMDETLESRGLYRVGDETADAELELLRSEDGEWKPAVIFLDTPRYQAGSLAPSGLWRFCSMEDLLPERELSRDTGLKADRSDSSLERPAMALMLPDRAGVMFKQEEDLRLGAFWVSLNPSPYLKLELGECLLLPGKEEKDPSWFPGEDRSRDDPVSITACELGWDRRDASFSVRAAASLGSCLLPSYSLLPGWRFYLDSGEVLSRIWYSSSSRESFQGAWKGREPRAAAAGPRPESPRAPLI